MKKLISAKYDEYPERDGRDKIWDNLIDDATGDGKGHCGKRCTFRTSSEWEHFCRIDPAVALLALRRWTLRQW